ncbi:MAG: ATP-binding protein [Candidatus Hinthialibacter antarcticus]|nr:ATP-binding protein [Candidatus Hinthialibacter antarcticus]
MASPHTTEALLGQVHEESQADQSAVYFFGYPTFNSLIFCAKAERRQSPERYWRSHCTDSDAIQQVRQSPKPIILSGETISESRERMVGVPIANGVNVIGVVVHCYMQDRAFDFDHLQNIVNKRADSFFNSWVEFLVAEQSRPLSALFDIAGSVSSSLDLDRVLINVVEQATILFRAKMSSLMLVDAKRNELEMVTAYGCSLEYLDKPNLPIDGTVLGRAVKEKSMQIVENLFEEPHYLHKELAAREGVCALLAAPIIFQERVLGVLNIYTSMPRRWQRSERDLLLTFANHTAIAITNARVHEQVLSMEEQLHVSAKLATVGEIAAGLAHEIRNPLAVINMLIHSWKGATPTGADFEHDINVIIQKISDMNSLVTDLLNLAITRPLERTPVNMNEVIDRVLRLLRHRISQQRVLLRINLDREAPEIRADRERIEQAVLNLLLNALDVTPEAGTITVALWTIDDTLKISVADSGPGIPEDRFAGLFKPFNSTKKNGFGLGLPISKRIVEEHKGDITVSSAPPDGATFLITLPYDEADDEPPG